MGEKKMQRRRREERRETTRRGSSGIEANEGEAKAKRTNETPAQAYYSILLLEPLLLIRPRSIPVRRSRSLPLQPSPPPVHQQPLVRLLLCRQHWTSVRHRWRPSVLHPELLVLLLRVELLLTAVELLLLLTELLLLLRTSSESHHHGSVDGDGELLLEVLEVVGELHSSGRSCDAKKRRRASARGEVETRRGRGEEGEGKGRLTKTRVGKHHHVLLNRVVDSLRISVGLDVVLVESFLLLLLSESCSGVGCWTSWDLGCWRWGGFSGFFGDGGLRRNEKNVTERKGR